MDTVDGCCAPVAVLRTVWSGARSARIGQQQGHGLRQASIRLGLPIHPAQPLDCPHNHSARYPTHAIDDAIERRPELAAKLAPRELPDGQHGIVLDEETRDQVRGALVVHSPRTLR